MVIYKLFEPKVTPPICTRLACFTLSLSCTGTDVFAAFQLSRRCWITLSSQPPAGRERCACQPSNALNCQAHPHQPLCVNYRISTVAMCVR